MKAVFLPLLVSIAAASAPAVAQSAAAPAMSPQASHDIAMLRDRALAQDEIAWNFVEGITTEVGPRQAGTEAEARGRDWAVAWLRARGFANVRIEPYMMPTWIRGAETAEVVTPYAQPLVLTALGNSGATPPEGLTAPVAVFADIAALQAAADGSLAGKIAYIGHAMEPSQDGSSYGFAGPARWVGPSLAASKGAKAVLVKSIGTDNHRLAHTGNTGFADGQAAIPAAALSVPDAENLERMAARGRDIEVRMVLTPTFAGQMPSGNVIAEIVGRDPDAPMVLLACHLDSWDLGTGAIDDASGCGIVAAAALHTARHQQPLRTIRVLFAGAEEVGVWGGKAYAAAHGAVPHAVALESDFGADRIWQVNTARMEPAVAAQLAAMLAPLGIAPGNGTAGGGADIAALIEGTKTAVVDLMQDGTRYFDVHHTANDTLDKIDPVQLRQNVAAWTAATALLANTPAPLVVK
ncbi:M28 family peptidase [Croceicoccus sp. F390]|uniref:Carboxypeptidase Q n=1 Tax=Croceicoccus esteveae TaxID=3075597 RepID=A0ABU2ZEC4_9SPHN|nr:M28 family peptidase [Croceicoccus sp. F390]MDT0574725.1 M28 family peptidase [Croceicoccus sp. F390]